MRLMQPSPSVAAICAPTSSSLAVPRRTHSSADRGRRGGEALWQPAFRRAVFRPGTESESSFGGRES